ncbi:AraC family transcriptional regulator [Catenovulum agarivorans DS-2]|uniref:AraC family transcriptional regulator n=1 Tax=Catenovulum agarivorans DS-2 TaxID=1328313 RepID=W7QIS1_9ALTE|nr:helix-turn-helix domain-containing protein [Catenovulum agarivorans]EWH08837.1 AraC family transcriptional regulator [Catenovulum agarivorans DS-2]
MISNYLLAGFLCAQAAIPIDNLINFGAAFKLWALDVSPNLFHSFGLAFWLEAPLLLLYTRSLIYKNYQLKATDLVYFLPFVLFLTYFAVTWWMEDNQTKIDVLQGNIIATSDLLSRFIHITRECIRLIFGVMCLIELQRYQKQLQNEVADIESVDLNWLKILVIGFLVIRIDAIVVAFALVFSYELGLTIDHELFGLTSNYVVMLMISGLIFFSAGYSPVFKGISSEPTPSTDKHKEVINPAQVALVTEFMQEKKPYLNHLLTLENLASQLGMPARNLSNLINRHFDKNFFEFINYYRIEESKKLLEMPQNKKATMLDIMDWAGFNSKATFNTFFKKLAGVTPTEYRKNYWKNTG